MYLFSMKSDSNPVLSARVMGTVSNDSPDVGSKRVCGGWGYRVTLFFCLGTGALVY